MKESNLKEALVAVWGAAEKLQYQHFIWALSKAIEGIQASAKEQLDTINRVQTAKLFSLEQVDLVESSTERGIGARLNKYREYMAILDFLVKLRCFAMIYDAQFAGRKSGPRLLKKWKDALLG